MHKCIVCDDERLKKVGDKVSGAYTDYTDDVDLEELVRTIAEGLGIEVTDSEISSIAYHVATRG